MSPFLMLIAIFLPILSSICLPAVKFRSETSWKIVAEIIALATSAVVLLLLLDRPEELVLVRFSRNASISFGIDGAGSVFAGLIAILWPIAVLYSFEYMSHEERQRPFFMFYLMTYGVTLGIAFSGNILTMYIFYELLTLVTIPLVIHTYTREAVLATRKYIYYMLGGAALGFMSVVYILRFSRGVGFTYGGVLGWMASHSTGFGSWLFLLSFLGFSIKSAMFPFHSWLPDAGVAPTPVTALLHAVAVVKAGAFACIRLTYYCFGPDYVKGTWVQWALMALAAFTVVYGCSMAVKETHLKRRLAYSTVSNLSYILFGVTIMTPAGLFGALCHLVFHAVMKISAFFCAGAIMHQSHREYVHETNGFALRMPWVYAAFTVSALGMMGVPGTCGFLSKWYLASAAIQSGQLPELLGVGCLLISSLLTAIYMMTIVIRGCFPERGFSKESLGDLRDPSWQMLVPLLLFTIAIITMGLWATPLTGYLSTVAEGLM